MIESEESSSESAEWSYELDLNKSVEIEEQLSIDDKQVAQV